MQQTPSGVVTEVQEHLIRRTGLFYSFSHAHRCWKGLTAPSQRTTPPRPQILALWVSLLYHSVDLATVTKSLLLLF